jgi:site-specific DNA recombinase
MARERERLDAYIRVSRSKGPKGDRGEEIRRADPRYISPTVQREAIERWAEYKGIEIADWLIDEDSSGGTHDRPKLEKAVTRAVNGETTGIVSWKIDRFSRFTEHGLRDLRLLEAAGARLGFVAEDIDTSGPMGKFVYTIMLAMGEYFLDGIKSSWKTSKERAVARGARIGPALPGYKKGPGGVLELSEEADIMRGAYRIAAESGLPATVDYLKEQLPDRVWETSRVRRLLSSRVYLGEVSYGDLSNPDAHPPLVSRREWEAGQIPARDKRRPHEDYPLSGVAICAGCKRTLVGSRSNDVRVYRCKYGKRDPCPEPCVISAERLEEHARSVLRRVWLSRGWQVADRPPEGSGEAQTALEEAEAELYAFAADTTIRKTLGAAAYQELLNQRVKDVEAAQEAFREEAKESALETRTLPIELLDTKDPNGLRELLQAAFRVIEVRRGRGNVAERTTLLQYGSDVPITTA